MDSEEKQIACWHCDGVGSAVIWDDAHLWQWCRCDTCNGQGFVIEESEDDSE